MIQPSPGHSPGDIFSWLLKLDVIMERSGKADHVIQASGCGPFQVLMVLSVYVVIKVPIAFVMMFMSFGNYNPGWRCLDNSSHNHFNATGVMSFTDNRTSVYRKDRSCQLFKTCQYVEFDPNTSTIVTEWGLLCDKDWVPSLMISILMAGVLVGSSICGQLGDTFGRKKTLYGALCLNSVLNAISIFSPSWPIFIVFLFLMGMMSACCMSLYFVLPTEFLSIKWRGRLAAMPSWHMGGVIFAVTAMLCKDWKIINVIGGGMGLLCCLTALWVPESLRWLEVKKKTKQFEHVAKKIVTMNKTRLTVQQCEEMDMIGEHKSTQETKAKKHTMLDIFRKGYRLYSVIIALLWLSSHMIYYAITFGVKSMYGNFYVNLIILFAMEIPFSILPILAPNVLGRKLSIMIFVGCSSICLLTAMAFELWAEDGIRRTGTLILALIAKASISATAYATMTLASEVYPTVVRSIGLGYAGMAGRFGSIIAPYLIPQDPDTVYICYAAMGTLGFVCCLLVVKLPETKGQKLKEVFDDD